VRQDPLDILRAEGVHGQVELRGGVGRVLGDDPREVLAAGGQRGDGDRRAGQGHVHRLVRAEDELSGQAPIRRAGQRGEVGREAFGSQAQGAAGGGGEGDARDGVVGGGADGWVGVFAAGVANYERPAGAESAAMEGVGDRTATVVSSRSEPATVALSGEEHQRTLQMCNRQPHLP
jgi:hypothetical protein